MTNVNDKLVLKSGIELKNRLVQSPMTVLLSFHDGIVTQEEIEHYSSRANGFGAVITGTANVTDNGKGWSGELTVATDDAIPQLAKLAQGIQNQGAKAILQIFHAGRMSSTKVLGEQPVSASSFAASEQNEVPRELTNDEILEIIEAFGQATRRAIAAGFDGVEIHGANMYLLQQFFSPHSNRRTDDWGGNREKRYHFLDKVINRVFDEVVKFDQPFIVGYRFSPLEITNPGISFEDSLWLVEQLKTKNFDYLHLSTRQYERKSTSENYQEKSQLAYIHEALDGQIPLIGVGNVRNRQDIEKVLSNAELAAVGQQVLADPTFAAKIMENRDDEIVTGDLLDAMEKVEMPHPAKNFVKMLMNARKGS